MKRRVPKPPPEEEPIRMTVPLQLYITEKMSTKVSSLTGKQGTRSDCVRGVIQCFHCSLEPTCPDRGAYPCPVDPAYRDTGVYLNRPLRATMKAL